MWLSVASRPLLTRYPQYREVGSAGFGLHNAVRMVSVAPGKVKLNYCRTERQIAAFTSSLPVSECPQPCDCEAKNVKIKPQYPHLTTRWSPKLNELKYSNSATGQSSNHEQYERSQKKKRTPFGNVTPVGVISVAALAYCLKKDSDLKGNKKYLLRLRYWSRVFILVLLFLLIICIKRFKKSI